MINLLYIEDSPDDRECALRSFRGTEFNVACVESVKDAFNALACEHYDIVVCDMLMPGDDGLSFAKQFDALNTSLILTSGVSALKGFESYSGLRNYLGFILKPITPESIKKIMEAKHG